MICPKYVLITEHITEDTYWGPGCVPIICAEVHIRPGVTLTIEDTDVLFKECKLPNVGIGGVPFACLVKDSGATLNADHVGFRSQHGGFNNTGGLIMCGTLLQKTFEAYATIFSDPNQPTTLSELKCCSFMKLGNNAYNFNSLTLLGAGGNVNLNKFDVQMSDINVVDAGDDGLEILGGIHNLDRLTIKDCIGDCVDLECNASLKITESIILFNRALIVQEGCGPQITQVGKGPGLVEVIGVSGSTNTLFVSNTASVNFMGRITDKTGGATSFSGLFAGTASGDVNEWVGTAGPSTYIQGVN